MSTHRQCQAFCQVKAFHIKNMHASLSENYNVNEYRKALLIERETSCCAVFSVGMYVFWNTDQQWVKQTQQQISTFAVGQSCKTQMKRYSYSTGHQENRLVCDHMELVNNNA